MLKMPIDMVEVPVEVNENGKPLGKPDVGDHNDVVCGVTFVTGAEYLTICRSLYDMQIEHIYANANSVNITAVRWYAADRVQCEVALKELSKTAIP